MKNNGIETYIREHRKAFDVETPSDQVWSRIEAALDSDKTKKPRSFTLWLGIAASLFVVISVAFLYSSRKADRQLDIADINAVYARKEMRFASLIEEKRDSLQGFAKRDPVLYARFCDDLNKLDGEYERLKFELQNSPNQKVVVKAMVKNLELQLQVIKQQLSIFNEVKRYKEENRI